MKKKGLIKFTIQFSQPELAKTPLANQIKELIRFCIPKSPRYRHGLLVKVLFYTNLDKATDYTGSYDNFFATRLYDKDYDRGAKSVITLKVGPQVPPDKLLDLIAHESGHHISYIRDRRFGEKKADKLAAKIIEQYNARKS